MISIPIQDNYKSVLKDLLHDYNYVERDRFSKDDFVTIICPEHGVYYKTVQNILEHDPKCSRCSFLSPSRMRNLLVEARSDIDLPDIEDPRALYYRLLVTHKRSGLIFQKIGLSESREDFIDFWNPWKWKDFTIDPIDKIECSLAEAKSLINLFQKNNTQLKMTVPNDVKFNLNKTYHWDEIWQAKSKTIPVLRDTMLLKQQGKCTICNKPVKAPTLDHMHIKKVRGTGYIRAVCCSQCNTFIARSENNAMRHGIPTKDLPDVLRNIAQHLEEQTKIIHPTEVPKRKKVGVREWNKVLKYYFKVYPKKKVLPKKPTYVTETWLELKREVDEYMQNIELEKYKKKKTKRIIHDRSGTEN